MNEPKPLRRYLTTEELADELRTSVETVHYWNKTGKGVPSFKVGRRRLYAREDVDAFIAQARSNDGLTAAGQ